jgi:chaperonin GroES|tara:strand:+ start:396 stop:704 length:309 start_codon:yes stop_codon:yes gene_type:complete
MKKLQPVHDKIVVKPNQADEVQKTESGIILPDTAQQGSLKEGEVIAVGNGVYTSTADIVPIVVEVGDTIVYGQHAQAQEYRLNGEDVLIMSQNEVLSIIKED